MCGIYGYTSAFAVAFVRPRGDYDGNISPRINTHVGIRSVNTGKTQVTNDIVKEQKGLRDTVRVVLGMN